MDLDKELKNLPEVEDQHDNYSDSDMEVFSSKKKKKKKKYDKLLEDTKRFTDELDLGDDDKDYKFLLKFKDKHKNDDDEDGIGLFDTKGKDKKKIKNLEVKFKPEAVLLDKQLKDADATIGMIKDLYDRMKDSKYRGVGKMMSDVLSALNTANSNKLSVIKEKNALKKNIIDLTLKMKKDEKPTDGEEKSSEEFGANFFTNLFRQGRTNTIDSVNNAQGDEFTDVDGFGNATGDDIINERLKNGNGYRSREGDVAIQYESVHPEICVKRSFSTGKIDIVALDDEGNNISDKDYPVPTIEELEANGTLTFNNDAGTCTDFAGRIYRVIEVE